MASEAKVVVQGDEGGGCGCGEGDGSQLHRHLRWWCIIQGSVVVVDVQ